MDKEPTSNAEPLTFETFQMPNANNERGRLAREADSLSKTELSERAEVLGIDTSGTKEEITARVKSVARTD